MNSDFFQKQKNPDEWRPLLTEEEYHILREKGTEPRFSGKYNNHFKKGIYRCKACNSKLYESKAKFDSGCGWPSYDKAIEGAITYKEDRSHGMMRTEIICANCGGHQGHVFNDGPTKTGKRYCVNSLSINFEPEKEI